MVNKTSDIFFAPLKYIFNISLQQRRHIKKSRNVIKEIIARAKSTKGRFPKEMIIDGQEIFDQRKKPNCFNKFFADTGLKLASMISESQAKFNKYLSPNQNPHD